MKELNWYEYKLRGFSPGCQPGGHADRDDSHGRLGAIAYERALTEKEIEEYELIPLNDEKTLELEAIALETLNIKTLERQYSDEKDFHDISVWSLKKALEEAYQAGKEAAGE